MSRWLWTLAAALGSCAVVATARAETATGATSTPAATTDVATPAAPSENDKAAAETQFKAGLSLQKVDDFEAAIDAYRASIRLYPTKSALFNLANCLRATHRYPQALETLEQLQDRYGAELEEPMKSAAARQLQELRALTAEVRIDVVADGVPLEGASIRIDGTPIGQSPMQDAVRVKLGEHSVEVQLSGYQSASKRINLLSGQKAVESVELVAEPSVPLATTEPVQDTQPAQPVAPAAPAPPRPPPIADDEGTSSTAVGWALAGTGALLLAGGAVTGTWALSIDGELERECDDGVCPRWRQTDIERLDHMALATDILVGAGIVTAALGVTFILSGDEATSETPAVALRLSPGFVHATGSF